MHVKISEAEWEVMEVLWNHAPRTASEVVSELSQTKAWATNTIRTLLQRLVDKGVLRSSKGSGPILFEPLLAREECVRQQTKSFVERVFGGAAGAMLLNFVRETELSPEDLKELRRILKEKERK